MTTTEPTLQAAGGIEAADLRAHAGTIEMNLAAWATRQTAESGPDARPAANAALTAIDALTRDLYTVRASLVGEMRAFDDESAKRADALIARLAARRIEVQRSAS